jgi:Na+-transporting NADH:ubiquinone oxidoreductase subunit NqrA
MRRGVGRRGPSLMRAAATTAVVAGTATAVHHGMESHYQNQANAQQAQSDSQQAAYDAQDLAQQQQMQMQQMQQQMAAMQAQQAVAAAPPPPPAAAAPAAGGLTPDTMAQLQQLAQLKEAGVLSDEEFSAAKAKLLGL